MPKLSAVSVLFIFASACLLRPNDSANVLCMFTSSAKTQLVVFMAVANTLVERGHNLTVITTRDIALQPENRTLFRHIVVEEAAETRKKLNTSLMYLNDGIQSSKIQAMVNFLSIVRMLMTIQTDALAQEKFKKFLDEDNHFDLVLLGYFHNDYLLGMGARYKCPIAVICLGSPYGPVNRMVGNPEETSYVQFPLFGRSQYMSFLERFSNFIWAAVEPLIQMRVNQMMEGYYKKLFTADFYPKYSDVITNISLVLCNTHFSEYPVRPMVPALVEIGGIQNKERPDPLPEDIKAFLDAATNGTILFNVGSKIRGTFLRENQKKIILNVLSALDQRVLWNLDENEPPPEEAPPNILFKRLIPDEDVLWHENTKLFITDGRPTSINVAQYRGVPMLGMPIYGDEPYNIEDMTSKGYGVSVDIPSLTEGSLQRAIAEVLGNPRYKQKVKEFSNIYRDRPTTARETAAFWLEYVMRYRGALHMQSPLVKMTFVQYWNLDVFAVLVGSLYAFVKLASLVAQLSRKLRAVRLERCRKYKCS